MLWDFRDRRRFPSCRIAQLVTKEVVVSQSDVPCRDVYAQIPPPKTDGIKAQSKPWFL